MPSDRMLQIGSFFAALYAVYLYTQLSPSDFPFAMAFWALTLLAALVTIRSSIIIIIFIVGVLTSLSYVLGYALNMSRDVSLFYFPQILTMCIGSAWTVGILMGNNRFNLSQQFHTWVHRVFIIVSLIWTILSIRTINAGLIVDSREVTGFSYLTTSDLFAMFGIASLSRNKIGKLEFSIILMVTLLTVTILGSRSSIILLFAISIIVFLRQFDLKSSIIPFVIILPSALYAITNYIDFQSSAFYRLQTLINFGSDGSLSSRRELFASTFDRIDSNPFCLIVSCHAPEGAYAHNFISLIEHFGFIGLLLFASTFFAVSIRWRQIIRSDFFPLFLYATISIIITRAWVSPVFWVYLGIALFVILHRNSTNRRTMPCVATSFERAPKAVQMKS